MQDTRLGLDVLPAPVEWIRPAIRYALEGYIVLAYPKFHLRREDIGEALGLYLPFAELVFGDPQGQPVVPKCRDAEDQKFLALASRAGADALVSGDRTLLDLSGATPFPILTPAEFLDMERQG